MNMTPAQLAKAYLTERFHEPTTFAMASAVLFGVKADGEFVALDTHPDIYDLLESKHDLTYDGGRGFIGIAVHTTGWASPVNENGEVEGAPSQHPLRRRVALVACASYDSMGSAMCFADDPDDIVTDDGEATGALADALMTKWKEQGHPF